MNEDILLKIGAAYIRVSDERQDEYSPDSQLKKIRENAAQDGYAIPDEYVFYDDGISGRSVRKRGDFNRMIATAKLKPHPFDRIYVWKFSRFARNQEESIVYKNLLRKFGVNVKSVSEKIPEDHFGSLIERIIEWMDEFYSVNLGVEVTRGMTEKVTRGEPICAPAFGYIIRDKKYYPDEESGAADVVQEVFQRYANGEKQRAIAMSLGERGIRTKQGNMPENRWIDYMLHNPVYIGKIRWSLDGVRAASKRDYDNENLLVVDGHHEPLISVELWDKVQSLLETQKNSYTKYARREQPVDYMLKGLVRCSACGGTLTMSSAVSGKAKTRTMQCCNYSKGSCRISHSVTVPKLETALKKGLRNAIESKKFAIVPKIPKKSNATAIDYEKLILLEKRRLERAKDAYLAEIDTIEQYAKNKKEITARIEELEAKRDSNTTTDFNADDFAKKVLGVLEFIERDDVTIKSKSEALHTIIEKLVYEKANGNLTIYFHNF